MFQRENKRKNLRKALGQTTYLQKKARLKMILFTFQVCMHAFDSTKAHSKLETTLDGKHFEFISPFSR